MTVYAYGCKASTVSPSSRRQKTDALGEASEGAAEVEEAEAVEAGGTISLQHTSMGLGHKQRGTRKPKVI